MPKKVKKYGGIINGWYIENVAAIVGQDKLDVMYGPNLGYIMHGWLSNDPQHRGFAGYPGFRTSLVVKVNKAKTKIETLNTKYDLGEPNGKA